MIFFEKIEMSNLMSVGNAPLCIEYSRHKKTLVSADNGSGKSSILLDSLVFVLFGKPYRNITKPQLINSINGKKMLVKIWFSIGADKYNIVRGMKPNIFEIYKNDKLVNEDASGRDYQRHLENNILKMNYRTFTQVVVLSQLDYIPFMKLAAAHRRAFIEDILDIGIFSVMNNLLKDKIKQSEDDERRINADIRTIKEKAKMQVDFIKTLEDDRANRVSEIKTKVAALNTDIDALNIEGETLRVKMSPLEEEMKQLPRVRAKLDEIDNLIKQFEKTRAKHTNDLIFYETMTNCPTCKQNIGEDHKTHILHTVNGKLEQIETAAAQIATKVDTYQEKMIQLLNKQKELTAMMMELGEINTSINVSHELIAKYQREIIDISNQTGNIDDERNKLNDMAKQAVALNNNKKKLLDERMYHDTIHGMLKDSGIKTRIIRQYIPVFNRLIDKYLK
jgi:DNA repair exonuclease SbcCD ATPase subunit